MTKIDINFIKKVAKDQGIENLSDNEAKKAHKIVFERSSEEDYYNLKEYFQN